MQMFKKNAGRNLILIFSLLLMLLILPAGLAGAQNGTAINEDINKAVGDLEIPGALL
jgi:hypothetical protein